VNAGWPQKEKKRKRRRKIQTFVRRCARIDPNPGVICGFVPLYVLLRLLRFFAAKETSRSAIHGHGSCISITDPSAMN
jgi:hypothetical protein